MFARPPRLEESSPGWARAEAGVVEDAEERSGGGRRGGASDDYDDDGGGGGDQSAHDSSETYDDATSRNVPGTSRSRPRRAVRDATKRDIASQLDRPRRARAAAVRYKEWSSDEEFSAGDGGGGGAHASSLAVRFTGQAAMMHSWLSHG